MRWFYKKYVDGNYYFIFLLIFVALFIENYFALRPAAGNFDAASSMRFSLEHQNPLVAGRLSGGSAYNEKQFSLYTVADSNVIVWATKPAEEGIRNGMIMRLWNFAGVDKEVAVTTATGIQKAFSTTHIETDDQPLPLSGQQLKTKLGHHRMNSYRLFLR